MGVVKGVDYDQWPEQGDHLGKRTRVVFRYKDRELWGTIVRDDMSEPFRTIIRLDDGRHVEACECQYSPVADGDTRDPKRGEASSIN